MKDSFNEIHVAAQAIDSTVQKQKLLQCNLKMEMLYLKKM